MTNARTCQGCGRDLPPPRRGPERKWCSEKCRKRTLYSRRCVDCGEPCNTDGRTTDPAERCGRCNVRRIGDRIHEAALARAESFLTLRVAGLTNRQIAEKVGISEFSVAKSLRHLRQAGVIVPPSPYWTRSERS